MAQQPSSPTPSPQTPPTSTSIPAWIALLVAVGGIPAAAGWAFADQITKNPLQAATVAVVYLIGLAVVGSMSKIWQILEPRWVGPIAENIDITIRTLLSAYNRRYRQFIIYQHRFFDVKGLTTQGPHSLKLQKVFVELRLSPQSAHAVSGNPVEQVSENVRTGNHPIWEFLRARTFRDQHIVILGAPGSGKTTLLRYISLVLATPRRLRGTPILLFIRDLVSVIQKDPEPTLSEVIQDNIARLDGPTPPLKWFERRLAAGKCIVMLDGLDEVADPGQRQKVVAWVEKEMRVHARNRFIITSRPFGYRSNPLSQVTVLEIQPFKYSQVEKFVHNWYLANEIMSSQRDDQGVRSDAKRGSEDLLQRLRNSANLSELAVNPLLLTMIANVHRYRSRLPGRRIELYAEICEVFLGKRRQVTGLEVDLTPGQKQSVLQVLAYHMMLRKQREISSHEAVTIIREQLERVSIALSAVEFFKSIEHESGILLERENGVLSFAHLTFQEYLAASHIREHQLQDILVQSVNSSWWHETIRLFVAQADGTHIIEACIDDKKRTIETLILAIDCSVEAREIDRSARARLETVITEDLEKRQPDQWRPIAEALLAIRIRSMSRVGDSRAVDNSPMTNAEYQLFLDDKSEEGLFLQPDHWSDMHFPEGEARNPVVGLRSSDASEFCRWLTTRTNDGWNYQLLTAGETVSLSLEYLGSCRGVWAQVDGTIQFLTLVGGYMNLNNNTIPLRDFYTIGLEDKIIRLIKEINDTLSQTLSDIDAHRLSLLNKHGETGESSIPDNAAIALYFAIKQFRSGEWYPDLVNRGDTIRDDFLFQCSFDIYSFISDTIFQLKEKKGVFWCSEAMVSLQYCHELSRQLYCLSIVKFFKHIFEQLTGSRYGNPRLYALLDAEDLRPGLQCLDIEKFLGQATEWNILIDIMSMFERKPDKIYLTHFEEVIKNRFGKYSDAVHMLFNRGTNIISDQQKETSFVLLNYTATGMIILLNGLIDQQEGRSTKNLDRIANKYAHLLVNLAIYEARRSGQETAFEGIAIARTRS